MHKHFFARTSAFAVVLALFPALSYAAPVTPQKLLDRAMASIKRPSLNERATLDLTFIDRTVSKSSAFGNGKMHIRWQHREVPTTPNKHDSEGLFALESLELQNPSKENPLPASIDSPLAIEWKSVGALSYLRIKQIPTSIIDSFKEFLPSLPTVVGQWMSFQTSDIKSVGLDEQELTDTVDILRGRPFLKVIKVESKKKQNGKTFWRIRAKVNPTVLTAMKNEELKRLKQKNALTKDARREVEAKYRSISKTFAQTAFVAVVDESSGELQRLEAAGSITTPEQKCSYDFRKRKDVCKPNGTTVFKFGASADFLPSDPLPIPAPVESTPFEQFLQKLLPPTEDMADTTAATTTNSTTTEL